MIHTLSRSPAPSNAYKYRSLDELWAVVSEAHENLDEGNLKTDVAIAMARNACLAFLFETEDR